MANQKSLGVRSPGQVYKVVQYPTATGQTFITGDFVLLISSGTLGVTAAAAASATFANPTSNATRILGRAVTPAVDSTLNTLQPSTAVILAEESVEFIAPMYSATPANAVPTLSYIGTSYGMRQAAGGFPQVNIDDTSNVVARITDFYANDFAGWPGVVGPGTTQFANVYFKIIGSASLTAAGR